MRVVYVAAQPYTLSRHMPSTTRSLAAADGNCDVPRCTHAAYAAKAEGYCEQIPSVAFWPQCASWNLIPDCAASMWESTATCPNRTGPYANYEETCTDEMWNATCKDRCPLAEGWNVNLNEPLGMFNLLRIKGSGCFDQIYGYETLGFSCGCLYWCETRGMTYDPLSGNRWIDALLDIEGLDRLPENPNITLPDLPVPDLAGEVKVLVNGLSPLQSLPG